MSSNANAVRANTKHIKRQRARTFLMAGFFSFLMLLAAAAPPQGMTGIVALAGGFSACKHRIRASRDSREPLPDRERGNGTIPQEKNSFVSRIAQSDGAHQTPRKRKATLG